MTDTDGHRHRTTLPKGKMRPEVWERQLNHIRRIFPPLLVELPEKIKEPFVSIISDISSKRAAFFNGRLLLVGDALAQLRPHIGQGTLAIWTTLFTNPRH